MRPAIPPAARAPLIGAGAFLVVAAALFAAIMHATGGVFSFTLDDPYIHLAMAEEIARGGYGVNPGEPASASSSVIYPFLLAGLLRLGFGQFAALALNLAGGAAAAAAAMRAAEAGGLVGPRTSSAALAALALLLVLSLNLAGLAFTGLEHTLHVALTLGALLGVARLGRGEGGSPGLVACLALAPLVRFEGAAVLASGAAVLLLHRRWGAAAAAVGLAALGLALFCWRLHTLGLPLVPSSVLVKAGDGAHGLGAQFMENQHVREAVLVIAAIAFPLGTDVLVRGPRPTRAPALFAALALAAQLAVGTFGWRYNGWLHRYEAWAVALAAGVGLLCFGAGLRRWLSEAPTPRGALAAVTVLLLTQPFVLTTLQAPWDARSIRLQQREMHRFAAEVLRAPVAVNDLGWVSWRNDHGVLDLWGLASEPARRARQAHRPPEWMDALARAHGVRAAMIYDDWIGRAPAGWVRLGELRARVPLSVGPRVAFYATQAADAPRVREAVKVWARGLPAQDVFVFYAPPHDGEFTRPAPV